jgi:hypothetical protein
VVVFEGLRLDAYWLSTRAVATVWPVALLFVARLFFHRFDPARVRATGERAKTSWIGRFNAMAKPLARLVVGFASKLVPVAGPPSLIRSAATDALTTIAAFPLVVIAIIGFGIASLSADEKSIFTGVMPLAFAACAIAVADIACREKRAGTMALVFATPALRTRFVLWKFISTTLVAIAMIGLPLARAIASRPAAALPLIVGLVFTCAAATALGVVSANPKTFIVLFLTFWYVSTQDKGASPELDFAGWYGTVTPAVMAAYALIALAFLTLAQLFHARELRRSH